MVWKTPNDVHILKRAGTGRSPHRLHQPLDTVAKSLPATHLQSTPPEPTAAHLAVRRVQMIHRTGLGRGRSADTRRRIT